MNIEDIELIAKKVRDLYQSVREGNVQTEDDIRTRVEAIRQLAATKNVPFFIDEEELVDIMQNSEIGEPEEEEEESSEEEEYSEEYDEDEDDEEDDDED